MVAVLLVLALLTGSPAVIVDTVNAQRAQQGLQPLTENKDLDWLAQWRSDDMVARHYFSHTTPEGKTTFSIMRELHHPFSGAGETIARGEQDDVQTVDDFMASAEHEHILMGQFDSIGVGVALDQGGKRYTTVIVTRS